MLTAAILTLIASALVAPISSKSLFEDKVDFVNYPEWLCKQICEQSKGKSEFDNNTAVCHCRVTDLEQSDVNWEHLKRKAKFIGLHLEVSDLKSKKIKRAITRTKLDLSKKPNAVQNITDSIPEKIQNTIDTNTGNVTCLHKKKLVVRSRPRLLLAKHRQNQNQNQLNENQNQNQINENHIPEQQTNKEKGKSEVLNKHEELRRKIKERREEIRKRRENRLRKNVT